MSPFPTAPGTVLTHKQVLFSWALAEAYSPRWQAAVLDDAGEALGGKILGGAGDFSEHEQDTLIEGLRRRREYLVEEYIDKASTYHIIHVPIELVELLPVLPTFSWKDIPVPLGHYIDWDRSPEWSNDPRNAAASFMDNPPQPIYSGHPVIGYSAQTKCDVLIEGYTRLTACLWKHRKGENISPIPMIYCSVDKDKRLKAYYTR